MNEQKLQELIAFCSTPNPFGEQVTLIGATKTMDAQVINDAIASGLKVVAENRVQEFREKVDKVTGATWHFIGHLQTNKVKYLVGKVELIHSVDSLHLASAISERAKTLNLVQDVLIEVNVGGELSKSGFSLDNVIEQTEEIVKLENIRVTGLMAMLPKTEDCELKKTLCEKMRKTYEQMKQIYPHFTHLSMGMSEDYEIAVKCGSNMIRIGSLIFGKRNYGGN